MRDFILSLIQHAQMARFVWLVALRSVMGAWRSVETNNGAPFVVAQLGEQLMPVWSADSSDSQE